VYLTLKEPPVKQLLLSLCAAGALALSGTPAKADDWHRGHDQHHRHGWYAGYPYRWGNYGPTYSWYSYNRPYYGSYTYGYPYYPRYGPYYAGYPAYGFSYSGPYVSFFYGR
jgi:hypothetical protein